ncbi:MAG: SWIM zinc finger family protein [Thermomicrobiales bacterium]
METIPQLSEQTVRARFDPQSWQRGRQYARDGAIINARRQGMTLKASCIGSQPEPYRVEVTFNTRGIASADCSCPVGEEGYCKHVVALLLTWLEHPELFIALEDMDAALERREKADLIALIKRMLLRHPDLDILLALPDGDTRQPHVDPAIYRRQIATMLAREPYQWGDDIGIGWNLRAATPFCDKATSRRRPASTRALRRKSWSSMNRSRTRKVPCSASSGCAPPGLGNA